MRVLVVDDNDSVRRLLSVQLGLAGHEVHIAQNGASALIAIGQERPDVVVLDLMMPHVDGWQVLGALRAEPRWADLPVLVLSAREGPEDIKATYRLGASMVMTKPYDGDSLIRMLEELHRQAEQPAAL